MDWPPTTEVVLGVVGFNVWGVGWGWRLGSEGGRRVFSGVVFGECVCCVRGGGCGMLGGW